MIVFLGFDASMYCTQFDCFIDCKPTCEIIVTIVPVGDIRFRLRLKAVFFSIWYSYAIVVPTPVSGQRKVSPVMSILCMITANLRAKATQAFLWLERLRKRRAQSFSG